MSDRIKIVSRLLAILISLLSLPASVSAQREPADAATFVLTHENDIFGNSDRWYTSGLRLSWISKGLTFSGSHGPAGLAGRIVDATPGIDRSGFLHKAAFSLGQKIYTPADTNREGVIQDDRPYAGWTFFSAALHSSDEAVFNSYELTVGIVGPASLAGETQKAVHRLIHNGPPRGWDNQLKNEPGLMLTGWRAWRAVSGTLAGPWGFDIIPHAGLTLGNVMTFANGGFEARLGYHLPSDFGSSLVAPGGVSLDPLSKKDPRLQPGCKFGATLFIGMDGRAVARNIFLDGNTWQDSHSVNKKPFVADLFAGVSFLFGRWELTYNHVYRTEEFYGQERPQYFGSLSLAYTF